jgi:hypothetical protein
MRASAVLDFSWVAKWDLGGTPSQLCVRKRTQETHKEASIRLTQPAMHCGVRSSRAIAGLPMLDQI